MNVGLVEEIRDQLRAAVIIDDSRDVSRDLREMIGDVLARAAGAHVVPARTRVGLNRWRLLVQVVARGFVPGAVSEHRWMLVATVRQLAAKSRNSSLTRHRPADVDGPPLCSGGLVAAVGFIECGFLNC